MECEENVAQLGARDNCDNVILEYELFDFGTNARTCARKHFLWVFPQTAGQQEKFLFANLLQHSKLFPFLFLFSVARAHTTHINIYIYTHMHVPQIHEHAYVCEFVSVYLAPVCLCSGTV